MVEVEHFCTASALWAARQHRLQRTFASAARSASIVTLPWHDADGTGVHPQVEELVPDALGFAGQVYEHVLGEEKYTFIEDVKNPHSCTILVKVRSRPGVQ